MQCDCYRYIKLYVQYERWYQHNILSILMYICFYFLFMSAQTVHNKFNNKHHRTEDSSYKQYHKSWHYMGHREGKKHVTSCFSNSLSSLISYSSSAQTSPEILLSKSASLKCLICPEVDFPSLNVLLHFLKFSSRCRLFSRQPQSPIP